MTRASKPLLKLSEKQVTEVCVGWLRSQRYFCVRLNSGLMRTPDGRHIRIGERNLPDWAAFKDGLGFLLELKATGKRPTAEQFRMHESLKTKYGVDVIWTDSLDGLKVRILD